MVVQDYFAELPASAARPIFEEVGNNPKWNVQVWFPYGVVPEMVLAAATRDPWGAPPSWWPSIDWERVSRVFCGLSPAPPVVKDLVETMLPHADEEGAFDVARDRLPPAIQPRGAAAV